MTARRRRFSGPLIFLLVLAGGALIVAIGAGVVYYLNQSTQPNISIVQPQDKVIIHSGQGLMLVAEAQAQKGVQRVDFYINDLLQVQQSTEEGFVDTYRAAFPWYSSQVGVHKISAVAYDLQGNASQPAIVLVGVKPLTPRQPPSVIDSDQDDSDSSRSQPEPESQAEGETSEGTGPSESGQPDGDASNPQGAPSFQSDAQLEGLLNQADPQGQFPLQNDASGDAPPVVTLQTTFERIGEAIALSVVSDAVDDLGIERLELIGQGSLPGSSFHHILLANGDQQISFEANEQIAQGEWTVTAQAFDTSGQASELISSSVIIVPPRDGELPDVAIVNVGMPDIGDLVLQEWQMGNVWRDLPIDIHALLDFLYPDNVVSHREDVGCLVLRAGEVTGGIGLQLEVNCRYQPQPGNYILLKSEQYAGSFGQVSRLDFEEWNQTQRTSLEPGDIIEVIDEGAACGTHYAYTLQVGYAPHPQGWLDYRPMSDTMTVSLETEPCAQGSLGDALFLEAQEIPEGIQVAMGFQDGGDWSDQIQLPLGYQEVEMRLLRYLPERNIQDTIWRIIAPPEDLPGVRYEYIDAATQEYCGEPVYYSVLMQDPGVGGIPMQVYAQRTVFVPPVTCPGGFDLSQASLDIRPTWHISHTTRGEYHLLHTNVYGLIETADWPEEISSLHLIIRPLDDPQHTSYDRLLSYDLNPWSDQDVEVLGTFSPEAGIVCGGREYVFFLEVDSASDGVAELSRRGPVQHWTSPLCPPPPPVLENLHARSDCPESSTGSCIDVNWSPPETRQDWQSPLGEYLISKQNGHQYLSDDQTQFIYEIHKPDPRSGGQTYEFLLYGCTSEGICGTPSSMLNIHIPPTPTEWAFWSFDYVGNR